MSEKTNLPATTTPDRELVKEIAMDIGKEVVSRIRIMYPAAFTALGSSGQLSVRNCVHNEIMAALETMDAEGIRARLEARRKFRRERYYGANATSALAQPSPHPGIVPQVRGVS